MLWVCQQVVGHLVCKLSPEVAARAVQLEHTERQREKTLSITVGCHLMSCRLNPTTSAVRRPLAAWQLICNSKCLLK